MSSKQFIRVEVSTDHPALLAGLEAWLQLELLSDEQVSYLGQTSLSCPVSLPEQAKPPAAAANPVSPTAAATAQAIARPPTPAWTTRLTQPVNQLLERLMAELSVVWLLCLGVLLVVLSSAVLAATQWSRFSVVGQYLVLLAYTLIFWLGGRWAAARPRLQLTAKTLRIVALLLVPINLWAIDGLRVGRSPTGLLVSLLAMALLTGCTVWRYPQLPQSAAHRQSRRLVWALVFLGLAYLQLGWNSLGLPLTALYGGTVATAIAFLRPLRHPESEAASFNPATTASLLVIYSLSALLLRGFTTPEIDIADLGLAVGTCGALLVWLMITATEQLTLSGLWLWSGRSLLWLGWLLAVFTVPGQAVLVSLLGLGLRGLQLVKTWRSRHLLAALLITLQVIWLSWRSLPAGWQQAATTLTTGWTGTESNPEVLLGVAYWPPVILLIGLADWLYRRSQPRLAQLSERLALGLGLILIAVSSLDLTVLALTLIAAALTLLVVTWRRSPASPLLINTTHAASLLAVAVAIADRWPNLPPGHWLVICLGATGLEWRLSWGDSHRPWRESAWYFGCGLAGLSYFNLLTALENKLLGFDWSLAGLALPVGLTLLTHRTPQRRYSRELSLLATGLTVPLTLFLPWTRLVGLGLATVLSGFLSRGWAKLSVALVTVLFGLGGGVCLIQDVLPGMPRLTGVQWYPIGAIAVWALWLTERLLQRRFGPADAEAWTSPPGAYLYARAVDIWGYVLCLSLLLCLTAEVALLYADGRSLQPSYLVAMAILTGAPLWRQWRAPQNSGVYLTGWGIELLMAEALGGSDLLALATATVGLGLVSLTIATWLRGRQRLTLTSLQVLPLVYGGLAIALRSTDFTATTGGITLGAALIVLEVGRRWQSRWLGWLALAGGSLAWYELVLYQLSQATGGDPGDGLVILAGVAALIMGVYRLAGRWIQQRLRYPQLALTAAAHLHWAVATLLLFLTLPSVILSNLTLTPLALVLAIAVTLYPLWQGRAAQSETWLYGGLAQGLGLIVYMRLLFPALSPLDRWSGAIAVILAVGLYQLPWSHWGWPPRPWQQAGRTLPILVTAVGAIWLYLVNFWLAAGFYGWLSWRQQQIRLSYLSLVLIDWAIARWLIENIVSQGIYYVLLWGGSLLYVAQVDPLWQLPAHKSQRHWLRVLGLGTILLYCLLFEPWTGLPVAVVSLVSLLVGLGLRVRAFLYVGTIIFVLNVLNQLILLNAEYPLVKWMIGIVAGIGLIWVAADFERRREQWISLAHNWRSGLNHWQ
ncbi:hypothetical protein [Sphaerothrix gracilis]|uniref:hypothetical protein n=1 Tax=Sphaerothrix gracilis TaxID=3151835 RepID=UPI0031FDF7C6